MDLAEYFESTKGFGVLATANAEGEVDVAVYARPHVLDEETVAFIMADRMSHEPAVESARCLPVQRKRRRLQRQAPLPEQGR